MAQIQEKQLVVTLSKLTKNGDNKDLEISSEVLESLEAIVQELVGSDLVVEVTITN